MVLREKPARFLKSSRLGANAPQSMMYCRNTSSGNQRHSRSLLHHAAPRTSGHARGFTPALLPEINPSLLCPEPLSNPQQDFSRANCQAIGQFGQIKVHIRTELDGYHKSMLCCISATAV